MNKSDIINAYVRIRKNDDMIPDEVLDFMKDSAIDKLSPLNNMENQLEHHNDKSKPSNIVLKVNLGSGVKAEQLDLPKEVYISDNFEYNKPHIGKANIKLKNGEVVGEILQLFPETLKSKIESMKDFFHFESAFKRNEEEGGINLMCVAIHFKV